MSDFDNGALTINIGHTERVLEVAISVKPE